MYGDGKKKYTFCHKMYHRIQYTHNLPKYVYFIPHWVPISCFCSVLRNKRTISSSSSEANLHENTADRNAIANSRPTNSSSVDSIEARLTPIDNPKQTKPNESLSNTQQKNDANTITSYFRREPQQLNNGCGISITSIYHTFV